MILEKEITSEIAAVFQQAFGAELPLEQITLQPTRKEFDGTHTLVCFALAKLSKTGPEQTALQLGEKLVANSSSVSNFNVVKGFLNLSLRHNTWVSVFKKLSNDPNPGQLDPNGKEVMV